MPKHYNSEYETKKMRDGGMSERDTVMTDMKMSKKESKKDTEPAKMDMPEYPYGLKISLNTESLDKLGIKKLKAVGDYCKISGVGKVERVSESSDSYEEDHRDMSIQITKLSLEDYDEDM